ncbi:hypothetical protein BFW87_26290 [Pseudomonas fluorescens]|jgi:chromosome segregation ATPase|uniref:Chromosome partition protein Smc n=1 Tax=Pseudomonas fluorescens TaxID=294 RepID=A0A1T2Y2A1_PSEFL|nr:hypothetical protein [Pseudomonas fluorescens]OPA86257.1 hypothetical protein BFW87_26290 [Pseudomonas fluorescens]
MLSVRKPFLMSAASVIGLLAVLGVNSAQAESGVQWGAFGAGSGDSLATSSSEGAKRVLGTTSFTVGDLEKFREGQKSDHQELLRLNSKLEEQARYFDDFKRKDGSSSSASDSQITDLKRTIADQKSAIDKLKSEVDDLKRNSSSSSSSSSSELSRLKSDVSDQKRSLDDLKRNVDTLSSKVK